ncbi:hypothetical protein HKBW3S42_02541, partial [Candidatus Hakubella thermalkaliphila]
LNKGRRELSQELRNFARARSYKLT